MSLLAEVRARVLELPAGFEEHLARELAALRERWPQAPEPDASFAELVAIVVSPALHVDDLFLAWWCASGDPAGVAAFEGLYREDLEHVVRRFRDQAPDELRQLLRVKLFVASPGSRPKIAEYSGRGSLRSWLRVTALRCCVDAQRVQRRRGYEDALDEQQLLGAADLESLAIRGQLGLAVKCAFADAVARLLPRQRVFLRHVYVDQHTLEQIATTYKVHRATVARVLASARAQLIADTRTHLQASLAGEEHAIESAIRALDGHVDLSLSRVLR